jgi:UDP-N-acetylmuramate--alanine ligase
MNTFTKYYFLGIGGIGMSALARYFSSKGYRIAGYDRTESIVTRELTAENIAVSFAEDVAAIPAPFLNKKSTLVVLTPAIPHDNAQLLYFQQNNFTIKKRAEVLGEITKGSKGICVAGTHGKTTVSTMIAHLLYQSRVSCSAFLGGIANNYGTNLLLSSDSNFVIIEADEYDRSFHHLSPYLAVITSADPDHLDIYGTAEAYREAFEHFTRLISSGGALLMRKNVDIVPKLKKGVKFFTYSMTEKADFYAENIKTSNSEIYFDFVTKNDRISEVKLGVPAMINVENAVAAMAVAWLNGASSEELRVGIGSFQGVYRRFNIIYKNEKTVLIDDYAHHPKELRASILSIKKLYPEKRITGIFQPHLYSRTRDFAPDFAAALSLLDSLILLDIYPAREEPIEGVTSELILKDVNLADKTLISKKDLLPLLAKRKDEVIITLGAGDIENEVLKIKEILKKESK